MKSIRCGLLGLALFLSQPLIAGEAPVSAPGAAAQPAASESIEELDEVIVRGRNLSEEIVKAENEYYLLFNDLNKDDRYDTHCVYLRLDTTSGVQSRVCIPGFVADAMAAWAPFKARCQPPVEPGEDEFDCLDRNNNGRLSREEAGARPELEAEFMTVDADQNGSIERQEFPMDLAPPIGYQPPPPELVLMEGSKKWYDHMMAVTKSDPRLAKMADNLGGLYQQLAATQQVFLKLDAEAKGKKKDMSGVGPRGR